MVLHHAGGWVDALPQIPEESVSCRYLAEEKHIVFVDGSGNRGRMVRFPWLSVVDDEHDMTDFFTDLRITADQELLHEDIMSLYAHQRQRFPVAPIQVTTRDGDEIELDEDFQEMLPEELPEELTKEDISGSVVDDVSGDIIIPGVQNYHVFPTLDFIK
jgi:hypothetical protein